MVKPIRLFLDPAKIHLENYDQNRASALHHLLQSKPTGSIWHSNESYEYIYKNNTYQFHFAQSLIQREDKKKRIKFYIYNPDLKPLGKGGYGVVYPLSGSLKIDTKSLLVKPFSKKVVKIQDHEVKDKTKAVVQEYSALHSAQHLNSKPPIFVDDVYGKKSYLIMDRAEGIPLEYLLHPDKYRKIRHEIPELTVAKRLELTRAILNAVKNQVVDKNILHRDIKPGNLIVDLNHTPPVVTVIDFGFALSNNKQDYRRLGTRAYRAPETFNERPVYTDKVDVYALGRVLSYLWGDDWFNYYFGREAQWNEIKEKTTNTSLFSLPEIDWFVDEEDRTTIRNVLNSMLALDPDKRSSLADAIQEFSKIDGTKYSQVGRHSPEFKEQLQQKIPAINSLIAQMEVKAKDLKRRNFNTEAEVMSRLCCTLSKNTEYLNNHPDPLNASRYQKACLKEIDKANNVLQHRRDIRWLFAEIAVAIGLLGVGYLVAVGINYYRKGQLGLFTQTRSVQLTEEFKETIHLK